MLMLRHLRRPTLPCFAPTWTRHTVIRWVYSLYPTASALYPNLGHRCSYWSWHRRTRDRRFQAGQASKRHNSRHTRKSIYRYHRRIWWRRKKTPCFICTPFTNFSLIYTKRSALVSLLKDCHTWWRGKDELTYWVIIYTKSSDAGRDGKTRVWIPWTSKKNRDWENIPVILVYYIRVARPSWSRWSTRTNSKWEDAVLSWLRLCVVFQGDSGLEGPPGYDGRPGDPVSFVFSCTTNRLNFL